MTQLAAHETQTPTGDGFFQRWAAMAGGVLALVVASQVIASRLDDDAEVREAWLTDVYAVLVASLLFGGIALLFARRALKGPERRQERTVIGLSVFAAVLAVVGWWSAAPHLVALAAILLGRQTGAVDRSGGARAAGVVDVIIVLGLLVFTNTALVFEQL